LLRRSCQARGLPRTSIERIASEQTGITADTALRLAKALGTSAQLWLNLQNDYEVQIAKAGYRFGAHAFAPGEYVSIDGHEGGSHTFKVVSVEPAA
jgi:addiction module HigA family antidote